MAEGRESIHTYNGGNKEHLGLYLEELLVKRAEIIFLDCRINNAISLSWLYESQSFSRTPNKPPSKKFDSHLSEATSCLCSGRRKTQTRSPFAFLADHTSSV
jgi:hypothetical protein